METALDSAVAWWLEDVICDTRRDLLIVRLHEKLLVGKFFQHTAASRHATVKFSGVVAYLVADETNLPANSYDQRDDGYLHQYSRSEFLNYVLGKHASSAFDSFPKPSVHFGLATSDHVIHVLATESPHVEIEC